MKFFNDYNGEIYDNIDEVIDNCISDEYHENDSESFRDWINDKYDSIEICGYNYSAYEVADAMNDGCISELRSEYCSESNDEDEEDARCTLEDAEVGDIIWIQDNKIIVIEDEEEYQFTGNEIEEARQSIEQMKTLEQERRLKEEKDEEDLLRVLEVVT